MRILFSVSGFDVGFAQKGKILEAAKSLRHRTFFHSHGTDSDRFDASCRHLVVVEKKTGAVIGTYRLLLRSQARQACGFYSETEFDLTNIKKNCRGELLEMGRACVESSYRGQRIIHLMWRAILEYVRQNRVKYIFGCASIDSPTPEKVGKILAFFQQYHYAPSRYLVFPANTNQYPYRPHASSPRAEEVRAMVPSLIAGYLRMGACVCGEPIWDKVFNTADFFMLLYTPKMNRAFRSKFLPAAGS